MADIKTITETIASVSYDTEENFLRNDEIPEVLTIKLLKEKIDELVAEVNTLKGD